MIMKYCWRCNCVMPFLNDKEWDVVEKALALCGVKTQELRRGGYATMTARQVGERDLCSDINRQLGTSFPSVDVVFHHRLRDLGVDCMVCHRPLRTPQSQECGSCGSVARIGGVHYEQELLNIVSIVTRLKNMHPTKAFSIDGRLLGDLGECIAERDYELFLYDKVVPHYDGELVDGRKVQIKTTMKESVSYPKDYDVDQFLVLRLDDQGKIEEVYNGPGITARSLVNTRKNSKSGYYNVEIEKLRDVNRTISKDCRIPRRRA